MARGWRVVSWYAVNLEPSSLKKRRRQYWTIHQLFCRENDRRITTHRTVATLLTQMPLPLSRSICLGLFQLPDASIKTLWDIGVTCSRRLRNKEQLKFELSNFIRWPSLHLTTLAFHATARIDLLGGPLVKAIRVDVVRTAICARLMLLQRHISPSECPITSNEAILEIPRCGLSSESLCGSFLL